MTKSINLRYYWFTISDGGNVEQRELRHQTHPAQQHGRSSPREQCPTTWTIQLESASFVHIVQRSSWAGERV